MDMFPPSLLWNETTPYGHGEEPRTSLYVVIGMLSLLSVMGTAGNALVLYVFYRKKDKLVSTLFIIVLAFVDFTTCLCVIPYTIILESLDYIVEHDFFCKFYHFLITSNIPFSALIMVAIAIDRYFCICHPFMHVLSLQRAKIMTFCMGLFSFCLGVIVSLMFGVYAEIPMVDMRPIYIEHMQSENGSSSEYLLNLTHQQAEPISVTATTSITPLMNESSHDPNGYILQETRKARSTIVIHTGQCQENEIYLSEDFRWYYQRFYIILYMLCLAIVIVLYSLIYHSVLARRSRRARQRSKALPLVQLQNNDAPVASAVEETLLTQVNGEAKEEEANGKAGQERGSKRSQQGQGPSLNRKSTRKDNNRVANLKTAAMLFVVTVVFIVTFLPAFLMVLEIIDYDIVVFYLYFANNVANPVIYSFMNKNFRDDLNKILCRTRNH